MICSATTKLKRLFCDEEGWREGVVPSEKYSYADGNSNYWSLVEDYDLNGKYYFYLRDPSDFDIDITDENRWIQNISDESEAASKNKINRELFFHPHLKNLTLILSKGHQVIKAHELATIRTGSV